jgi:L-ascorbate metabolism protein UlaG (beta-lactamase superfamily)
MKITKYSHACVLVEIDNAKILTDPGDWTPTIPSISGLGAILITHEHQDHLDIEKVKAVLADNPEAQVITHAVVGAKLDEAGIPYKAIEPGEEVTVQGISIESFGTEHAPIYGSSPCRNTGFLIGGRVFVTGDALQDVPSKPVEVLALPTGGPWMKIAEAIDYAKKVKPKIAFAVHDAMYTPDYKEIVPIWMGAHLKPEGIEFLHIGDGESHEF